MEKKEEKRAESEAAQGFKSKTPIVENFLGCKGAGTGKRTKKSKIF